MKNNQTMMTPKAKIAVMNDDNDRRSSGSDDLLSRASSNAERRTLRYVRSNLLSPIESTTDTSTTTSNPSLTNSIDRYRTDFDDIKCKMRIFGESLNLCRCIAFDFKNKVNSMDKRLKLLENRQLSSRSQSNYSAIIKKNKALSTKTLNDAKKLQMCGTEAEMRDVAGRICRNYLHGAWKTVDANDLKFRKICGGLSNFLYYVALPDDVTKWGSARRESSPDVDDRGGSFALDEPRQVLLRIYGQVHGERAMDAIVTESVIFTLLSERRLGPRLHGVFSGGRIEEYIPARSLLTKELSEPALSMKIAEKMAAIHSMDVPLSKEPNWVWKTMGKWLKTVKEERLANTKGRNDEEQQLIRRLKVIDFDKEIEWLRKFLAMVDSPVLFCHNDLQEGKINLHLKIVNFEATGRSEQQTSSEKKPKKLKGNILILEDVIQSSHDDYVSSYVQTYDPTPRTSKEKEISSQASEESRLSLSDKILSNDRENVTSRAAFMETSQYDDGNTSDSHISDSGEPKLVLIDYEYCAYNYRGFDIANHFQEWGYDYTNPEHPFYFENQENCPTLEQKEIFIREYLKHYNNITTEDKDPPPPSIDAVNHLLLEVDAFALASHLFWCLWAIVNAGKSQIPFGYWEYAISRLDTYFQLKQKVVKGDAGNRPSKRKICEVDI